MADDDSGANETSTETNETPAAEPILGNSEDETWSPPKVDENGVALDGHDLPVNHRLRAEALADAGKDKDPGDMVSPELIAETADRLATERKARPPVSANMKVADLERIAKRESVDLMSAKNNEERVALIEAARGGENA